MNENAIKWMGGKGKRKLKDFIIGKMIKHKHYREAFAGSASIYLAKPPATTNVINDLNGDLINMYHVIKDPVMNEALTKQFQECFYSEELFQEYYELYNSSFFAYLKPVMKAFIFIYLNRTSFNAKFDNYSHVKQAGIVYHLQPILRKMFLKFQNDNLVIQRRDCVDFVKQNDTPDTLIYLDPPYWITTQNQGKDYYEIVMSEQKHTDLRDALAGLQNAYFLMSYDDVPEVRTLYDGCYIIKTPSMNQSSANAITGAAKKESVYKHEILIANYPIDTVGTLFDNEGLEAH